MAKKVNVGSKVARGVLSALLCSSLAFAPVVLSGCTQEDEYQKKLDSANLLVEQMKEGTRKSQERLNETKRDFASYRSNN